MRRSMGITTLLSWRASGAGVCTISGTYTGTPADPHHVFTGEEIAAYRPLPEFAEVLAGLQGRALQRARELTKLVLHE